LPGLILLHQPTVTDLQQNMTKTPIATLVLLIAVTLYGLPACSESIPIGARHHPSGVNSRFEGFTTLDFSVYRAKLRKMIMQARLDLDGEADQDIIDANLPFERLPSR